MKCKNGHVFDEEIYRVFRPSVIGGNLIDDPEEVFVVPVCPICKTELKY